MKLLIAEEAVRSLEGHWFEYLRGIVAGCRDAGDAVTVACHRDAVPEVRGGFGEGVEVLPTFPVSAWEAIYRRAAGGSAWRRLVQIARHNVELFRATARLVRERGPFDATLAPTILVDHLAAWTFLAWTRTGRAAGRLTLLFVNGHGVYQGPGKPTVFPRSAAVLLTRGLLRALGPRVRAGRVVLAAETEAMAREFERLGGVPFQLFPHPVRLEEAIKESTREKEEARPVCACLGFARYEKGSDLLQDAIRELHARCPDLSARFVIQWSEAFKGPEGETYEPDAALRRAGVVEFIEDPCEPGDYAALLCRTDVMLLPYRAKSYHARVSRVAIEAAVLGIPMVYTAGTWLEELVTTCGAGLPFDDGDVHGLAARVEELLSDLPAWRARARARAEDAQRYYSAARFRDGLLGGPMKFAAT